MLSIRLSRKGRSHRPFYRIVVADSRRARDGRFLEVLGHYDPLSAPPEIVVDADKAQEWIGKGAKPSDTVRTLLKKVARAETHEDKAQAQQEGK